MHQCRTIMVRKRAAVSGLQRIVKDERNGARGRNASEGTRE